jgi:hypothetical protein
MRTPEQYENDSRERMPKSTPAQRWSFSDDPLDPCAYCVAWTDDAAPLPVWPDGTVPPRLYRYIHDACNRALAQTIEDARR